MAGEARRLILAFAALGIATAASASRTTGAALLARIDAVGGRRVLEEDFNLDGGPGYAVVETGSVEGIAVAVKLLATVADAAYSEGLQSSLGKALQRHPDRVLPLVDTTRLLGADHICLPFLSIEARRTTIAAAVGRTRIALDSPAARRYPRQRSACLAQAALVEEKNR